MKQLSNGLPPRLEPAVAVGTGARLRQVGTVLLLGLGLSPGARAQQRPAPNFFTADAAAKVAAAKSRLMPALRHAQALTLDVPGLRAALATAPAETRPAATPLVLVLPLPDGNTARFALREAPVMEPELAAKFPEIKTYAGVGLDDASATVRLDLSPQGFHAQVITDDGNSFYIDPATATDARRCLSFYRRDMDRAAAGAAGFSCGFKPSLADKQASAARLAMAAKTPLAAARQENLPLRTYRLALANTPEYALTKGNTAAGVLAGEVATVNRVVGVYERELAVRMVLVQHNDRLIFLSGTGLQPHTPYDNFDGGAMLAENQANIDRLIGPNHYDIGHVVSTGGGGIAGLGVVCNDALKAEGVTGSPNPVSDAFDIDYVAHEMGHQFAGNHTFNGEAGSCGGGNRNPSTAFEPGSGSTIMAYAGICTAANDLQPHSDPFFHTGNYEEMRVFIESGTCAVATPTGNTQPLVSGPASGKTLPVGTPFRLLAQGDDNDASQTYLWEEVDLGPADAPADAQVAGRTVPLFRSFMPSADRTRYFPRLSDLLNNTTAFGERLPTVSRTLRFRCTARTAHDGPSGVVGSVAYTVPVELGVTRSAGPFVLTAPNTAVTWMGGSAQAVTWNVANTAAAPVSCARVAIRLSLDGGLTYPVVLAADEPNDGTAVVLVPRLAAANAHARLLVEAADNYFFDISNTDFTIAPAVASPTISSFSPTGGPVGTVVTVLGSNFGPTTAVKFNGRAAASFAVVSATQLTATVAAGTTTGPITVTGSNGTATSATPFVVGTAPVVASFAPATGPEGSTVVIRGTGFAGVTRVAFGGIVATTFTVNSATQITVTVPAGATTGPVAVTTPVSTGQSASSFVVIQAPEIAAFTPGRGFPGTVVTITGSNFSTASQVTFGGAAAPFTVNSATQITATVPAAATSGPIAITGVAGVGISPTDFLIPPPNDQCASARPIACGQTLPGTTIGADAVGDPTGSCTETVDGAGVFYSLVGTGQTIVVSTCNPGTNYDSKLFVYTGTCGSYVCVGGNDDGLGCNSTSSKVTFASVAGTRYLIFVSGYAGATGLFALSATCGGVVRPALAAKAAVRNVQPGDFSVYPNPVAGQGTMRLSLAAAATSARATLRNVLGQPVASRSFSGSSTELTMSGLVAGTYLLTVQADGQAPITRRVMVE